MFNSSSDVIIVGGGVIGCSIAYYLAKNGIKSIVFEERHFASGASGATAGMITPLWHVDHTNKDLFDMGISSLLTYPDLVSELLDFGTNPEFHQSGVLKLALSAEEVDILTSDLVWQRSLNMGVEWLNPSEIMDQEPEITPRILGGVFSPTEGHITGKRLVNSLVHAATKLGAVFFEGVEVTELLINKQKVTGVRTAKGCFYTDNTILATGPWTGLTNRWIPGSLPIRPVKGQRFTIKKPGFILNSVVHSFKGTSLPQANGDILIGATREESKFDSNITVDAITEVLLNAHHIFPGLSDAIFVDSFAGVRPGSPDNIPVLGPIPGWSGISIASGHDWAGVMLAPSTGKMMAKYIQSGDSSHLDTFLIDRF